MNFFKRQLGDSPIKSYGNPRGKQAGIADSADANVVEFILSKD